MIIGSNDHTPRLTTLSLSSVGGIDRGATARRSLSHGTHTHDVENRGVWCVLRLGGRGIGANCRLQFSTHPFVFFV